MGRLGELVIVLFLLAVFIIFLRGKKSTHSQSLIGKIEGPKKFAFDIVGESFYDESFEAISENKKWRGHEYHCEAKIIPYDTNPHDNLAVKVEIDGWVVGHLDREAAKRYREHLKKQGLEAVQLTCDALVASDKAGSFFVKLDLPSI